MAIRTSTCACSLSARPRRRCFIRAKKAAGSAFIRSFQPWLGPGGRIAPADVLEAVLVAQQCFHAARVEQLAGLLTQPVQGFVEWPGMLVGSARQQGVEHV